MRFKTGLATGMVSGLSITAIVGAMFAVATQSDDKTQREIQNFGVDAIVPVCADEGQPLRDVGESLPADAAADVEPQCRASVEQIREITCDLLGNPLEAPPPCPGLER